MFTLRRRGTGRFLLRIKTAIVIPATTTPTTPIIAHTHHPASETLPNSSLSIRSSVLFTQKSTVTGTVCWFQAVTLYVPVVGKETGERWRRGD